MDQKLITKDLYFSIKGKELLKNIALEFNSGSLQAILGPNGSGKSTLLKVLAGIWSPSAGSVLWKGKSLLDESRKFISSTITLVPQNQEPSFNYLVHDIVAMGRYLYNRRYWEAADESEITDALKAVDALHLINRPIMQISCGERQRVYIARALVTKCPILLFDEPTASLDIRHKTEIWDLLKEIVKEGKIVIIATHDMAVAEKYCDKVALIEYGSVCGNGPFKDVMTKDIYRYVFGLSLSTVFCG